jgi:hypothetical protein
MKLTSNYYLLVSSILHANVWILFNFLVFFLDDINEFNSHIIICVDLKLIQEGHRKYFFVINI